MRIASIVCGGVLLVSTATASAHELWFHLKPGDASTVRLTFGDSPNLGEAERVAEIAHARVWADGQPVTVDRLPDGLEAHLPAKRPAVLSAYADRGVINYQGDTFVIQLAAYAQTKAMDLDRAPGLGLDDNQARLLLVTQAGGPPVVRALWKGQPAANVPVSVFHGTSVPTEVRTNERGEIACPDLREGPWTMLAQVHDRTPGKRDGREYTHTRYKATLTISTEAAYGPLVSECLDRVKEIHGETGPWAVAGYRMGDRALRELKLPRRCFTLLVVHHCPSEVQYSCVADGLQAATGTSPGKLNLRVEKAPVEQLRTIIKDTKSGRTLYFTLQPAFVRAITDLPHEKLAAEGQRVAALPDEAIFDFKDAE